MLDLLELGAVIFTGIFAGAALYVTVVEQAAREQADVAASLAVFKVLFHKAAKFQIPLLVLSVVSSLGMFFLSGGWLWVVTALAMVAIVPFTLLILMPLNNRLLATEPTDPELSGLLKSWGPLQLVRTSIATVCFGLVSYLALFHWHHGNRRGLMNHRQSDALEIAKRIRVDGNVTDSNRWYIGLSAPMLLIVDLALEPSGLLPALFLLCGNTLAFFYRIWTWKMASKTLELLVLPIGTILVICVVAYLYLNEAPTWLSPIWIVGAFFTPMLVL